MSTTTDTDVVVHGVPIYEGHYIKVLHSEGKRDGFVAEFKYARYDDGGNVVSVDCWGGKGEQYQKYRTIPVERVQMLSARKQNRLQRQDAERREKGLKKLFRTYSQA